jgi:hypothetical protein
MFVASFFFRIIKINVREYRRCNQKDNPEKLATWGTQDEEKQNTRCVGHHYAQIT